MVIEIFALIDNDDYSGDIDDGDKMAMMMLIFTMMMNMMMGVTFMIYIYIYRMMRMITKVCMILWR
jgi:hypothetical protein